jgi:EAL and modified HD-GYP domain-containing signal transduction protein
VLDRQDGFINVSVELLMSDVLELLPQDRVVLELLETIEITDQVIERCRELKARGFRLALDDFEYSPVYDPLFAIVDIVKFDVMNSDIARIQQTVMTLQRWPHLQLLAEKVEDASDFARYRALGFNMFQGYFFARPAILAGKKTNPDQLTLMRICAQLAGEAEIVEIERTFKESASLTLGLLRLVNSVGMGLSRKIGTLQQALVVLGRRQLQRWVQLLLYAQDGGAQTDNPVMQAAALRARLMERLAGGLPAGAPRNDALRDQAFIVGMLSLVDAVIGMSLQDILAQLVVADEIRDAVLHREGILGQLLTLVVALERDDTACTTAMLGKLGIAPSVLNEASLDAMQWVSRLTEETPS